MLKAKLAIVAVALSLLAGTAFAVNIAETKGGKFTWRSTFLAATEDSTITVTADSNGELSWTVYASSANAHCEAGVPSFEPKIQQTGWAILSIPLGGTCGWAQLPNGTYRPTFDATLLRLDGQGVSYLNGDGWFGLALPEAPPLACIEYQPPEGGLVYIGYRDQCVNR